MEVGDEWVTGEVAVNAFERLCIEHKWLFVRVPGERDFGKDGYVDATERGTLTGDSFAVQIKGGTSYRAAGGYRIRVGEHGRYWRESSIPVIGIVQDPADESLYWVNLTAALRIEPYDKSVFVSSDSRLGTPAQLTEVVDSVRDTQRSSGMPLGLGSTSTRDQVETVWDAFALAASHPETLVTVRRSFGALDRAAQVEAVVALSLCTPHPDVIWGPHNTLPPPSRNAVRATMRWSVQEVWQMLALVDPESAFQRGSLGQCIFMLLREDPDLYGTLKRLAVLADDLDVAHWAAALVLESSDDPHAEWNELVEAHPELASGAMGSHISEELRERGVIFVND